MSDLNLKFEVGDLVKFVLRNGKIEEGVLCAVIKTTAGVQLNIAFGMGLIASVKRGQIVEKTFPR
jgi:hypothetical protein